MNIVESGLMLCLFSTLNFSNALSIASCYAWLLEHLLSSLNCNLAIISLPLKITAPDPTPCSCLLPLVYTWIDVPLPLRELSQLLLGAASFEFPRRNPILCRDVPTSVLFCSVLFLFQFYEYGSHSRQHAERLA